MSLSTLLQGMDTNLGSLHLAPATLSVLDCLSVIIFVAIYDLVIQPFFIKIGKPIGLLTRIGMCHSICVVCLVTHETIKPLHCSRIARRWHLLDFIAAVLFYCQHQCS